MGSDQNDLPLVSIVVITYNSSKYILETLESIKAQTYQNIELIVSDDCSTDNTVELCMGWLQQTKLRFVHSKCITINANSGISANLNRGIKEAKGIWIKGIAGDDVLLCSCINDYINFIKNNAGLPLVVYANMNVFNNDFKTENFKSLADYSNDIFSRSTITAFQQLVLLVRYNYIGAPALFFKKSLIAKLGFYDEEVPYEDWPMYISIVNSGNKIYHLNKATVNYRIHNESAFNNGSINKLLFNNFYIKDKIVYFKYRRNHLTGIEKIIEDLEFKRKSVFFKMGLNKNNYLNRYLNDFFVFLYRLSRRTAFYIANKTFKWI